MIYVDTSVLVALLTAEPVTTRVTAWYLAADAPLVSADWCAVEFASALSIKQRAKQLRPSHARTAHAAFATLVAGGLQLLPVGPSVFQEAAKLCAVPANQVRAGDALHLAAAMYCRATGLASLDVAMCKAAQKLGLRLESI